MQINVNRNNKYAEGNLRNQKSDLEENFDSET